MRPIDASHHSKIEKAFREAITVIGQFLGREWLDGQALKPGHGRDEPIRVAIFGERLPPRR